MPRAPRDTTPSVLLFARLRGLAAIWWGEHDQSDLMALKLKPAVRNAARYEVARLLAMPGVGVMRIRSNRGGYGLDYFDDELYGAGAPEGYEPDEDLLTRAEAIGLGVVPGTLAEQRQANTRDQAEQMLLAASIVIAKWLEENTDLDPRIIADVRSGVPLQIG